jgi:hypothetical protein
MRADLNWMLLHDISRMYHYKKHSRSVAESMYAQAANELINMSNVLPHDKVNKLISTTTNQNVFGS